MAIKKVEHEITTRFPPMKLFITSISPVICNKTSKMTHLIILTIDSMVALDTLRPFTFMTKSPGDKPQCMAIEPKSNEINEFSAVE